MNLVVLIGRLVADPELRVTTTGKPVCNFRIAVDRPFVNQRGERETDFLNVIAWNKQAEALVKYMSKGRLVSIEARLQSRSYEHKGQRRYVVEIIAEKVRFLDSKKKEEQQEIWTNDEVPAPF